MFILLSLYGGHLKLNCLLVLLLRLFTKNSKKIMKATFDNSCVKDFFYENYIRMDISRCLMIYLHLIELYSSELNATNNYNVFLSIGLIDPE